GESRAGAGRAAASRAGEHCSRSTAESESGRIGPCSESKEVDVDCDRLFCLHDGCVHLIGREFRGGGGRRLPPYDCILRVGRNRVPEIPQSQIGTVSKATDGFAPVPAISQSIEPSCI